MVFQAANESYGFGVEMSAAAANNYMAWRSGCAISYNADMTVTIAAGVLIYEGEVVTTSETIVTISAAHATLIRRDMIVYNGTTFVSIDGTPADDITTIAKPDNIDCDANVVMYLAKIEAASTVVDSNDVVDYKMRADDINQELTDKITNAAYSIYDTFEQEALSVTDVTDSVSYSEEKTNHIIKNIGANVCYINLDDDATITDWKLNPTEHIIINGQGTAIHAICESTKTTDIRIIGQN